jgi:hypothetical protein
VPLYFFSVRNGSGNLFDEDGVELSDVGAAQEHARCLARELMFRNEARKRHWWVFVLDGARRELYSLPFVAVDDSIQHLNVESRRLIQQMCEKRLALAEAVFASKMGVLQARAAVARSKSRPFLAACNGRVVAE